MMIGKDMKGNDTYNEILLFDNDFSCVFLKCCQILIQLVSQIHPRGRGRKRFAGTYRSTTDKNQIKDEKFLVQELDAQEKGISHTRF